MEKEMETAQIHLWSPSNSKQVIVAKDGKLFKCFFHKLFGHSEKTTPYETFIIGKDSYINQLDIISHYTNFFINNYDLEYELPSAYLHIKYALDKDHLFDETNMKAYIDFLYEDLFTDTMVDKIIAMVEDNYLGDIESSTDEKKKYLKNEKKHLESLEFTNQHIKILLQISFGMKIMSPALFHYIQKSHIKIEKDSEIIFQFYQKLFTIFGHGVDYEIYREGDDDTVVKELSEAEGDKLIKDNNLFISKINSERRWYFELDGEVSYMVKRRINLYNKLYVYVKAKVLESNANNSTIFMQREIVGTDVYTVVNQFVKKVLISENVVK